jgi:hypothetical protein
MKYDCGLRTNNKKSQELELFSSSQELRQQRFRCAAVAHGSG